MADIIISKKNETLLNVDCDSGIMMELSEHFSFFVDGYKFTPSYKAKQWSGKIKLFDTRFGTLPVGLYSDLVTFTTSLEYTIEVKPSLFGSPNDLDDATYVEVKNFVNSLNIHSGNKRIEPREFQFQAIYNCIKNQRQISVSPTGSGKSLILFSLFRWYHAKGLTFMMVVPNLSLIKQMYSDFKDYSSHNGFDVDSNVQVISEGADKTITKPLILCTWQSIFKQPASWYNGIDSIAADECHSFKSEATKGIFEKATNVKYRFGVTGSLDKSATNKMLLRGLIGEISQVKTTKDLIDDGHLSELEIHCLLLKYNKYSKKLIKDADYQTEIDFLFSHEMRNKLIRKLALQQKGVTLVLFSRIDHGEKLYEDIKKNASTQKVHLVHGDIEADDRELIRKLVQESDGDHIIVASVGTMAVGVNLPRISTVIFAAPTKSVIRVMQSIGRGLRLAAGKLKLKLYDIADSIVPSKAKPNYTMTHFIERLRIYNDEKHEYKITEIQLENV